MINTLERLAILVVAAVGLVFVYGTLSMAWAEEGPCLHWMLELTIGSRPVEPHTYGVFTSREQCLFIAKHVAHDLRKTHYADKITVQCLTSE